MMIDQNKTRTEIMISEGYKVKMTGIIR